MHRRVVLVHLTNGADLGQVGAHRHLDLRRDTAIYNLNKGVLSIEEVAQSVGFAEPTSFFRAFKRWTGVTPRVYILKGKDLNPSD